MKLGHTIEDSTKKYPELSDELLLKLEEWIRQRNLSDIPVEQLAIFAHSCYFQIDATLRCMEAYYKIRTTFPEVFSNRDPNSESLQCTLKKLNITALPVPDPNGYRIIFKQLKDTDPNKYKLGDALKLLMMTVDATLYTEGCEPGYIFLFDMTGVSLGHLSTLSISSIRKFFQYIQDGIPFRLKGIHILNATWILDKVLAIIRPFMNPEFFKLIHPYTGDVSEVYQHIPPKCLPKDFGGELDYVEVLKEQNDHKLQQLREYFLEEELVSQNYSAPQKKKK
ncbi:PREDICTED: alpha-tocopherol transfer protein-like [Polistes dominula]|uniref:Alpha-tocopherol transfer protein-like n=1 Tax=Polistes dominula TaxID=743375 RepID=A0ABM1J3V8_POLDO|nr:PREDICTED: alpha-tocopherol transfer protein-like [Polistes dominula]XP_015187140.1 PREDICTED: alpha-tocopherol transfer protein-like [Polistes dominula]XP_015187141.1 PREDICTED: alpha-tocopherol transfer protein-like [Polistes dominula]XP_015187142.1 PREDICTED: alpha-tocopherol transfer protein-like [Polistes dominula]XP_015187143.1 PREDICTED: alpha-tocopherol transfer protein-like [Polistes dominula]XP_015187145.1 PREDICTED: alpha-tocopherol transfer protein-like [Polistes dominula]